MRGAPSEGGDPTATSEPLGGARARCLKLLKKVLHSVRPSARERGAVGCGSFVWVA